MHQSDKTRTLQLLNELRTIGKYKTGVHRPTFSDDDIEARKWVVQKLIDIGYKAEIDGIGNVFGKSPKSGKHLLSGSHLETQNYAGWLDGSLGVMFALEAARILKDDVSLGECGIDVVAFADEETHFSPKFIGSNSFAGLIDDTYLDQCFDRNGRGSLKFFREKFGLYNKKREILTPERHIGFIEAHIEQGPELWNKGLNIGIVRSIAAAWKYRIKFTGETNHAGTTKMNIRRDAGVAMMKFWNQIETRFPNIASETAVWTVGAVKLTPGQPSIIPGEAEMVFQFRDVELKTLKRLDDELVSIANFVSEESKTEIDIEKSADGVPAHFDENFISIMETTAKDILPGKYKLMSSGAQHDAQVFASIIPTAMVFVPSINGVSHHWTENTSDEDIVNGFEYFVEAMRRILQTHSK